MHLDAVRGFRPDRWLSTSGNGNDDDPSSATTTSESLVNMKKPDSDWYVPYGFGPRYCLGKNLAQLEMKIFLAALARNVDHPKLAMLPENYNFKNYKNEYGDYF